MRAHALIVASQRSALCRAAATETAPNQARDWGWSKRKKISGQAVTRMICGTNSHPCPWRTARVVFGMRKIP